MNNTTTNWIYDIEVFPNVFMLTTIKANTNPQIIKAYEQCAIKKDYNALLQLQKALHIITFIISPEVRNDLPLLNSFMSSHKTMIGYNNHNYDNLILDYICAYGTKFNNNLLNKKGISFNTIIYELSQNCISFGGNYRELMKNNYDMKWYKRLYDTWDIQRVLYLDKKFVSLKQVAIMLKWYLVQDLPFNYNMPIPLTSDNLDKLTFYNINDCLITKRTMDIKWEEINLRSRINNIYNINVKNESRSGIANTYFLKFYSLKSNKTISEVAKLRSYRHTIKMKNIISDKIKFDNTYLQNVLSILYNMNIVIGSKNKNDKLELDITYNNKVFQFRTGGLHSKDASAHYKATSEWLYIDADVTSFYPYIILNLEIHPEHLDKEIFLSIIKDIVENRIKAKDIVKSLTKILKSKTFSEQELNLINIELEKFSTKADALKIVVNAIYGKFGDEYSPLYDLNAMYQTTINGQLFLLMLIEKLANKGFQNISANTDGILTKVHISKLQEYYDVCNEWSNITGFMLEFTNYEQYICSSVNDYIAIKEGFSKSDLPKYQKEELFIKKKGLYVTDIELDKGYFAPVISKVLEDFYCYNIPIETSLYSNKDIYDFCISKKTNSEFITVFESVDNETKKVINTLLQKNNRFYITSKSTGTLVKRYKNSKPNKKGVIVSKISLISKQNIQIFNEFYKVDNFDDYSINYKFYYNEIMKIVIPIEMSKRTLFSEWEQSNH